MACKVAENRPLESLRASLGIPKSCHSARPDCLHGLSQPEPGLAHGAAGAALGYCQALFARIGSAEMQTSRVLSLLTAAGMPWAHSHELFWGYHADQTAAQFITGGISPLRDSGRVPIVISGLDPATDHEEIASILASEPPIARHETMLLRLVLGSARSFDAAFDLIDACHRQALAEQAMPRVWPLFQASGPRAEWQRLRERLGSRWRFVNLAVNPFVDPGLVDELADQVTVAQIAVGDAEGVRADGTVSLPATMKMAGAGRAYALDAYIQSLARLDVAPTLIVLGPSDATWSDTYNVERLDRLMPLVRTACDALWAGVPSARRRWLWQLPA